MNNQLLYCLLTLCLFYNCKPIADNKAKLSTDDVASIVLVGGSLISNMEVHGFFEEAVIRHFPKQAVSFRNIGWPADDVYGLARSQFGSAQNTRSWQPPTAEEGFGSKVLMQHITEARPKTLIIGYGSETAFAEDEKDFKLFTSGYVRLLNFADSLGVKLILLSPPKQEVVFTTAAECDKRNKWLGKASAFIQEQAASRKHLFIDLYSLLIVDPLQPRYTENGIQLNRAGYERMNDILLNNLGITPASHFSLQLDEEAKIVHTQNCEITDWRQTVHGVSFQLRPGTMLHTGEVLSKNAVVIFENGRLAANSQDTLSRFTLRQDSLRSARLSALIREKNRLHRYRLRPLNEAYIYLFRRHEMGHLAYEMDDLEKLVEEKEREIRRLLPSLPSYIEIELIRPWQSPKNYPEDEVPAFIPEPDIEAELAAFTIAEGFEINLFAADPMIANPINVNWDTKGRAWVATSSTYPHIVPGREPNDRIIILEDTDKDGRADKHTVFAENLLVPHSVMPVPGGAYVTATTELLFLADTDGDDRADQRRVVYSGFGNADVHHTIHGLRRAPWGDLHFTQSIYINSFVETAYGVQVLNGTGTWSFRPETEKLEVFSRGLINPWGQAFDEWGQCFATDGAHSTGISYVFPGSAHATAVGAARVLPGLNEHTPKNTAAEVVYSRHFPADWQGNIITNDFRANRTVRYEIAPYQSGYQSREVETIVRSDHRSYRPVDVKTGPDGALYIVDWYNPIIDHGEVDFHHPIRDKTHGRIWRLTRKGNPLVQTPPIHQSTVMDLLNLLKSPEQLTRLQANRTLVAQNCDPQIVINWAKNLRPSEKDFNRHRLEGLWLLTALHHYHEPLLLTALASSHPRERAAAVRMLARWNKQSLHGDKLARLINDPHPQVRLEAIHALRQMGGIAAAELVMQVLDHPMDVNLEFAIELAMVELQEAWLTAFANGENIFDGSTDKQLFALLTSDDPRVAPYLEDLIEQPGTDPELVKSAWLKMARLGGATVRAKVLAKAVQEEDEQLLEAMIHAPETNDAVPGNVHLLEPLLVHDSLTLRLAGLRLTGKWKVKDYVTLVTDMPDAGSKQTEILAVFRALVSLGKVEEVIRIAKSHADPAFRTAACVVWIEKDPENAVGAAVILLENLESTEQAALLFRTFLRIEDGPEALGEALQGKRIPEPIASRGLQVVQTSGLNLVKLEQRLRDAGSIQAIGMKLSEADKNRLIQDAQLGGSTHRGREIYRRKELLCATCHRINGIGGLSGPDLTTVGSYMTANSILKSVLEPNSDIKQGYETVLITKTDGEVISGLLHRKTGTATLVRLSNSEIISIPNTAIRETDVSPVSLMPAGLTRNLHKDELRDLLAYLMNLGMGQ